MLCYREFNDPQNGQPVVTLDLYVRTYNVTVPAVAASSVVNESLLMSNMVELVTPFSSMV